jgi:hypothetical protein
MAKLGDIVTYVTDQGQPRMAFVSAEVVEPPKEEAEPEEERIAREAAQADEEARLEAERKQREEEVARQAEVAQAQHTEAEALAGAPIQLVVTVPSESLMPAPVLPPVPVEEEEPTGPELTLHVLLHAGDAEFALQGAMAIYAGVKHSDKNLPHTWHCGVASSELGTVGEYQPIPEVNLHHTVDFAPNPDSSSNPEYRNLPGTIEESKPITGV